jgi:hypothetical protein
VIEQSKRFAYSDPTMSVAEARIIVAGSWRVLTAKERLEGHVCVCCEDLGVVEEALYVMTNAVAPICSSGYICGVHERFYDNLRNYAQLLLNAHDSPDSFVFVTDGAELREREEGTGQFNDA